MLIPQDLCICLNKYGSLQLCIEAALHAQVTDDRINFPLPSDKAPNKQILSQIILVCLLQALNFTILQVSPLKNGISKLKLPRLCCGLLDEGNDPDLSCSNTFFHNQSDQYFPCIARMPLKNALRLFKTKITASATQNGHSVARLLEKFQLPAKLY